MSPLFILLVIFSLFSGSICVRGEDPIIVITPSWNLTSSQLYNFVNSLDRLERDTWGWHWGPAKDCDRWINQTLIDQAELDFFNGGMGARGGGFYISFSTFDSRSYGPVPVGILLPKGSLQMNLKNSQKALSALGMTAVVNMTEWVALGRIVPFIDTFTETWSVVHNATLTHKLASAWYLPEFNEPVVSITSELGLSSIWSGIQQMTKNESLVPALNLMQRHWSLFEFLGPINAVAMRQKYGDQIWNQIDTRKFEAYHQLIIQMSTGQFPSPSFNVQIVSTKLYLNPSNSTLFGESQVRGLITLYNLINPNTQPFRGDESAISTVNVIDAEYKVLQNSPYIEIRSVERIPSNQTLRVFFRNPSVFNIKKIKASSKISSELLNNITSFSPAQLKSNTVLRNELNTRLMRELLVDLLNSVNSLNLLQPQLSGVFQDILRIAPFSSDNLLMKTLYERTVSFCGGKYGDFNGLVDIVPTAELFPSYQFFRSRLEFSNDLYILRRGGLGDITKTLFIPNFPIDYFKGWDIFQNDYLTGSNSKIQLNPNTIQLIQQKQTTQVFDQFLPNWRKAVSFTATIQVTPTWWISQSQADLFMASLGPINGGDQWMYTTSSNLTLIFELDKRGYALPQDITYLPLIPKSQLSSPSFTSYIQSNFLLASYVRNAKYLDVLNLTEAENIFYYKFPSTAVYNDLQALSYKLPFLLGYGGVYYVTGSSQFFTKVTAALRLDDFAIPKINFTNEYSANSIGLYNIISLLHRYYGSEESIQSLKHLMLLDYLGPVQANRMRIQNGNNIWNKINMNKFNRFFNTIYNCTVLCLTNQTAFAEVGKWGSFDYNFQTFESSQINALSFLWRQFTGGNSGNMFRDEESWNRGKGFNSSVIVVDQELESITNSPFLQVKIIEKLGNNTYKVSYQHPDIFNITKFQSMMSKELIANITSYSKDELINNKALRRELNRRLMSELLTKSLTNIRGQNLLSKEVTDFFQKLELIQPFNRENYLMRRMYQRLAFAALNRNSEYNSPIDWIPELTPLRSSSGYYNTISGTSSTMSFELLKQIVNPQLPLILGNIFKSQSNKIDYFNNWDLMDYVSFYPSAHAKFDQQGMKWIEKGEFTYLLNRDFPQWIQYI